MKAILLIPVFSILLFSCQPEKSASDNSSSEVDQKVSVKSIGATEFQNLSKEADSIILDVRTPEEVAQGKIPNAIVIDIYDSDFETKVTQLPKEKSILIYCSAGVRSAKAGEYLTANGYTSVYHLQGGLGDWYKNDFPLEK
jgi:rhodanese-related sulfurtransferase